jgi:hypothetical protein
VLKPDKNDSDHRKLQPSPSGAFLGAGRTPATMLLECRFFQKKKLSRFKKESRSMLIGRHITALRNFEKKIHKKSNELDRWENHDSVLKTKFSRITVCTKNNLTALGI